MGARVTLALIIPHNIRCESRDRLLPRNCFRDSRFLPVSWFSHSLIILDYRLTLFKFKYTIVNYVDFFQHRILNTIKC